MASLVGVPVPASASPASSRACSASSGSIGIERKGSHYEDDWRGNAGVVVRHSGARNWGGPGALVRSGAKVVLGGPAADRSKCGAPKERAASEGQSAERAVGTKPCPTSPAHARAFCLRTFERAHYPHRARPGNATGQAPLQRLRPAGDGTARDDAELGARLAERVRINVRLLGRLLEIAHRLGAMGERVAEKPLSAFAAFRLCRL